MVANGRHRKGKFDACQVSDYSFGKAKFFAFVDYKSFKRRKIWRKTEGELSCLNLSIQTTPIRLQFSFVTRYAPYSVQREGNFAKKKKFIFLENFELQNSNLPSIFLRSCESRMTVTTMASQEEEAGSDKLSDEEVFSETLKKAASRH